MKKIQKFKHGDHVQIAKDLGHSMKHFTGDCEAIVIGSYKDQYGGSNTKSYTLHLKGHGQVSWYEEHQLTLIEANRIDLLKKWQHDIDSDRKIKSNLDWIFANGKDVLEHGYSASIEKLAEGLGCNNLWGKNGEGITYYTNSLKTLAIAEPFLLAGDKAAWRHAISKGQ